MKPCNLAITIGAGLWLTSLGALADQTVFALTDPGYRQECGSCHVPYPPQLLPAPSWQAVMSGLDKHFGVDASLERPAQDAILDYLVRNAGRREASAGGKPLLRITETRWFQHEHDELSARVWTLPAVKSPANCGACHTAAEKGDYAERSLRVPRAGGTP